jgi:hypothetical protein
MVFLNGIRRRWFSIQEKEAEKKGNIFNDFCFRTHFRSCSVTTCKTAKKLAYHVVKGRKMSELEAYRFNFILYMQLKI